MIKLVVDAETDLVLRRLFHVDSQEVESILVAAKANALGDRELNCVTVSGRTPLSTEALKQFWASWRHWPPRGQGRWFLLEFRIGVDLSVSDRSVYD